MNSIDLDTVNSQNKAVDIFLWLLNRNGLNYYDNNLLASLQWLDNPENKNHKDYPLHETFVREKLKSIVDMIKL